MTSVSFGATAVASRYAATASASAAPSTQAPERTGPAREASAAGAPARGQAPRAPGDDRVTLSAAASAPESTRTAGTTPLNRVNQSQRLREEAAVSDNEASARLAAREAQARSEQTPPEPVTPQRREDLAEAARRVDRAASDALESGAVSEEGDARQAAQAEQGVSEEDYAVGSAFARADAQRAEADRLDAEAGGGAVTQTSEVENFRGFGRGTLSETQSAEGRGSFSFSGGVRSDGTTLRVSGEGDAFDQGAKVAVETTRPAVATSRYRVFE